MHISPALAVFGSLAAALASALPPFQEARASRDLAADLDKRRPVVPTKEEWCNPPPLTNNQQGKKFWDQIGGSGAIDNFIQQESLHGRTWLKAFEEYVLGDENSLTDADGCSLIGGDCKPGTGWTCNQYWDKAEEVSQPWLKTAYWIFRSVKGVHAVATEFYRQLNEHAFLTSLRLDAIIDTFSGQYETDENMLEWVSAAMEMVGGGFGGIPGLGDHYGLLSKVLSLTAEEKEEVKGIISEQLASAFEQQSEGLREFLRTAMGHGTTLQELGLPGARPSFSTLETPIANFYNVGVWLADIDESGIEDQLAAAAMNLERKVAHEAMKAAGWVLVTNKKLKNEAECHARNPAARWVKGQDGNFFCATIYLREKNLDLRKPKDDFPETLAKYGITDLGVYYKAIIDCYDNGDFEGNLDLRVTDTNNIKRCFYFMPIYEIRRWPDVPASSLTAHAGFLMGVGR